MLRTSDAWSTSHLSQQPNIIYCRLLDLRSYWPNIYLLCFDITRLLSWERIPLWEIEKETEDNQHSQHSWIFGNAITHQHKDMMNKLFSLSRDFCYLVLLGKVGCRVSKQNMKIMSEVLFFLNRYIYKKVKKHWKLE